MEDGFLSTQMQTARGPAPVRWCTCPREWMPDTVWSYPSIIQNIDQPEKEWGADMRPLKEGRPGTPNAASCRQCAGADRCTAKGGSWRLAPAGSVTDGNS